MSKPLIENLSVAAVRARRLIRALDRKIMDIQIWDKLLLLIAGGVLTALGAWVNDLRSERRRKNAKLEEAYLAWLNSQSSVIGQLKELMKLAEREPESIQFHELLMEKFERLHSDLQTLTSALNLAFIYERNRKKKAMVETQSLIYAKLTEALNIIIRHHRTHIDFHTTIDAANTLVSRIEEMEKLEAAKSDANLAEKIAKLRQEVQHNRDEASNHLSKCSLSNDAKKFSKDLAEIEGQSSVLRRALVE